MCTAEPTAKGPLRDLPQQHGRWRKGAFPMQPLVSRSSPIHMRATVTNCSRPEQTMGPERPQAGAGRARSLAPPHRSSFTWATNTQPAHSSRTVTLGRQHTEGGHTHAHIQHGRAHLQESHPGLDPAADSGCCCLCSAAPTPAHQLQQPTTTNSKAKPRHTDRPATTHTNLDPSIHIDTATTNTHTNHSQPVQHSNEIQSPHKCSSQPH